MKLDLRSKTSHKLILFFSLCLALLVLIFRLDWFLLYRHSRSSSHPILCHVFSPYILNAEFHTVSHTWWLAKQETDFSIDHLCIVESSALDYLCPSFARILYFSKGLRNYKAGNPHRVPTYGELLQLAQTFSNAEFLLYTNADIAVVPTFYRTLHEELTRDVSSLTNQHELLTETRDAYVQPCLSYARDDNDENDQHETLCLLDGLVYFENLGGRSPVDFPQDVFSFFKRQVLKVDLTKVYRQEESSSSNNNNNNALTITRAQFPLASNATEFASQLFMNNDKKEMNLTFLREQFSSKAEFHPGNDLFALPRNRLSAFMLSTPFTHLRPSGFLLEEALKLQPDLRFRKLRSSHALPLTFHLGPGTDEWPVRTEREPRQVLFELAHFHSYFPNFTRSLYWPEAPCDDTKYYRRYGANKFCFEEGGKEGNRCRGHVRWGCTKHYPRASRDTLAMRSLCFRMAAQNNRVLEAPFCSFCNDLEGTSKYTCATQGKIWAEECTRFACHPK